MKRTKFPLEVQPVIPTKITRLNELSNDLVYSWDRHVRGLFFRLDKELWEICGHNPKLFLQRIGQDKLNNACEDPVYMQEYHRVLSAYDGYLNIKDQKETSRYLDPQEDLVAYFCAEFGLHESLPIYSGGLGILAGDHCKAASDMAVPFVAIGILYRQGYFTQQIDAEGNQVAIFTHSIFNNLPISPVTGTDGEQLRPAIRLQGHVIYFKVWEDDNGLPGQEIFSAVQVSGNSTGWNERDITADGLFVSGDFWFGTKNFSSTQDWGLDTDSVSGNSIYAQSNALDWLSVEGGNLMLRVVLDCPSDDVCGDTVSGDTNGDGITNILDVVGLVNFILGGQLDECGLVAADFNQDGVVNILDVVGLVSSILGGRISDASSAIMYETASGVDMTSDGYLGAVELTLSHDLGFELELTSDALVAEYKTNGTTTKLIVVAPETDHIFTTEDAFEVDEVLAVNSHEFIDVVKHVSEFNLSAAYPNPFNPTTNIDFSVSEAGYASVKVYNLMGQVVGTLIDGMVDADTYSLTWDAQHLSSGVYMIKAESNGQVATQKIMLLK